MSKIISICDKELIQASSFSIGAGQPVIIKDSGDLSNDTGTIYNSARATVIYENLTPDPGGSPPFQIGASIEVKDDVSGLYAPVGYQFNPYRSSGTANKRIIIVQPSMDTFSLGIEDVIVPLNSEECRISREQGFLREGKFRIVVKLIDNDPTGPNAFVSIKLTAEVELYNV